MDLHTARELIALDNRFYAEHAASFSDTRQAPWAGWRHLAGMARARRAADPDTAAGAQRTANSSPATSGAAPMRVLDLACGNLRFERFLAEEFAGTPFEFHALDSCPALIEEGEVSGVHAACRDVLGELLDDAEDAGGAVLDGMPPCDLSVCFGFMHHVPTAELRSAVLDLLVGQTAPGGAIVISFWQFMNDGRIARNACTADIMATVMPPFDGFNPKALDPHDHFLGWQESNAPLRYCHHFPEDEIDELAAGAADTAREVARFSADGASGALNRYLVLERLGEAGERA